MQIHNPDISIIGGGMVGLSMALALADSDLKLCLIDKPQPAFDIASNELPYSPRVSALTMASIQWLESLGVWQRIAADRACFFTCMDVWDGDGTGHIHFDAADAYADTLGAIVENSVVVQALEEAIADAGTITMLRPDSLASMPESGNLLLNSGQQLQTRLVIGADGGNSLVRKLCGFNVREWDYPHKAIVTTVAFEKPHQNTAWQRFMTTGPLAFLPLITPAGSKQHVASIVWSCVPELCDELMALDDVGFMARLGKAFEYKLGNIQQVNKRFAFPLQQRHAADYVMPGIALIGDAAHTIHPLAGQGVNLGLQDAKALASVISQTHNARENFGHEQVLSRYQRQRKGENLGMMTTMEGFARLFGSHDIGLTWLRNAGMTAFNGSALTRKAIMRKAMGV